MAALSSRASRELQRRHFAAGGWGDAAMSDDKEPPLTPEERRRRAVQLCCNFMRNLGFHRAGMQPEVQGKLFAQTHPHAAFWRKAHVNFLDICVLEWCKLFADNRDGKHYWRRVVAEPDRFEADLYATLGVTAAEFADLITKVRDYRDKFVAHLDEKRRMDRPMLEQQMQAVDFLFERLAREASSPEDWQGLPTTVAHLDWVHAQARQQAQSVYAEAMARCP